MDGIEETDFKAKLLLLLTEGGDEDESERLFQRGGWKEPRAGTWVLGSHFTIS